MSKSISEDDDVELGDSYIQLSANAGYIKGFIESVECLREEGILTFREDTAYAKVNDPANVAMCLARLEGQSLNSFNLVNAEELNIGVEFQKMKDCVDAASNTDEIEISWPVIKAGKQLMRIDIVDENIQFDISTVDTSYVPEPPTADPISHKTRVVVEGSKIKKAIKNAKIMIDVKTGSVTIGTLETGLQISSYDKVEGSFKTQFDQSGPAEETLEEHSSLISLSYLDDIMGVIGTADNVTIQVREDYPVRIDANLDDNGDAQIIYIIAPRIEDNE